MCVCMYVCMYVCMDTCTLGWVIVAASSVLRGRGFGNMPTSRGGETAAGGPRGRRVGYECTPGGSFVVGAISKKVFGILI